MIVRASKMGFKVQVYIYDLTQGMARSLGPAILAKRSAFMLLTSYTYNNNKLRSRFDIHLTCT